MPDHVPDPRGTTRREAHFGDRVVRCFVDRPSGVLAMLQQAADRAPQREALVCGARRLTWRKTLEGALHIAGGLRAKGVARGDRIALLLGNEIEFPLLTFAAAALGAVIVPIGVREQAAGIAYILRHSGARLLVYDAALADRLPAAEDTPEVTERVAVGAGSADSPFEALRDGPRLVLDSQAAVDEESVAAILYTSGTTGQPKGAMLTHFNIVHSAMHYEQMLTLREGERCCVSVPLSHVTGLAALLMVAVRMAGTLVVMPQFRAAEFLLLAARERIGFALMVPAMYALCLLQDDFDRHDLSAWRVGGFGGAPMPPATIDALAGRLPGLGLSNCYGSTETTSPATITPTHLTRDHLASVGLPVSCGEVSVMDEQGREVPVGEPGELWLRGPMVVKGYWNNPLATAQNFVGGFWRSGDLGRVDAEGFVYVLDRQKDMLNRGGFKVYSVEVENLLCQHPEVLEAAVVGRACPVLGERVHAFVTLKAGARVDAAALRAFGASHLADYKVPETLTVDVEPLPRNANGKLLKRELRERLLASIAPTERPAT